VPATVDAQVAGVRAVAGVGFEVETLVAAAAAAAAAAVVAVEVAALWVAVAVVPHALTPIARRAPMPAASCRLSRGRPTLLLRRVCAMVIHHGFEDLTHKD
jgi:hypothetical protein